MKKQKWMHITKQSKRKYYREVIITKKRFTHMKNQCKLKKVKVNRRNIKSPAYAYRIEACAGLLCCEMNTTCTRRFIFNYIQIHLIRCLKSLIVQESYSLKLLDVK